MKIISLAIISMVLIQAKSCDKNAAGKIPECIQQMIVTYQSKPKQNPSASIYQYDYNGQKVYYVVAPCCDQLNTLYDANCTVICHPDGGFTGKGDGKCNDFNTAKTNEVLIWKDERP
ncbi:MAG: hypothetical protein ABI729_07430 [Chitinophagales bacterium]